MDRPPDSLDARTPDQVYADAIRLARRYLPDWAMFWPAGDAAPFASDDPGLVVFKLLAQLHSAITAQLNQAPDKYSLAFLDFFGVELRAPRAASAPLTFTLTKGSGPVTLPPATQVANARNPNLVFETTRELVALPVSLEAAYVLDPGADAFRDAGSLVGDQPASVGATPIPHTLLLGSEALFQQSTPLEELSVTFQGVNLLRDYFERWTDGAGKPLRPSFDLERFDALTVSFDGFVQPDASMLGGSSDAWVAVSPSSQIRIRQADAESLPRIYSISATARSQPLQPEATFANGTPVDTTKGGQPLGAAPAVEDAFYIASADVFGRVGAQISIEIDVSPIDPPSSVELVWEAWSDGWQPLVVLDGTSAFTRSGTVSFTCPVLTRARINGRESLWVRARIAAGGYGSAAGIVVTRSAESVVDDLLAPYVSDKTEAVNILEENNLNFGYQYRPATFTPPWISALWLRFQLTDRPQQAIARNGFSDAPLDVMPFSPVADLEVAYYFGFEPSSFLTHARGHELSLLAILPADGTGRDGAAGEPTWSAFDGSTWRALRTRDGTHGFTTDGIVALSIPDWVSASSAFGREEVWLRLSAPEANPGALPPLSRLIPNAVEALNGVLWTDSVLGSGTGGPGLSLSFPRTPVLEGQVIEVLERTPVLNGPGADGAPLAPPTQTAVWVRWTEVSSFAFSTSVDRHYVLDHASGIVTFGDGTRGMAPPAGQNNIVARSYRNGGGSSGNVAAGALTQLQRARDGVASVTNPVAAQGGVDSDTLDVLRSLGPRAMKAQDRALSGDDLATLALLSSQRVVRATAYRDAAGGLKVAVLPNESGARPVVTSMLVEEVTRFVRARSLPLIASSIAIVGPRYVPIAVEVEAVLAPGASEAAVRERMNAALASYFQPLGSASRPQGWSFGDRVSAADLARLLQGVSGVAAINGLSIGGDRTTLSLVEDQLPTTGSLDLEVSHAG